MQNLKPLFKILLERFIFVATLLLFLWLYLVNLLSRNEAFPEMYRNGVERFVIIIQI